MTTPGPMMEVQQVLAAEQVVANAVTEMQAVAQKLAAQSGAATVAMKAPAGQITSEKYTGHAGAGRALAETLDQLQRDLASTRQALLAGSDQATSVANRVEASPGASAITD